MTSTFKTIMTATAIVCSLAGMASAQQPPNVNIGKDAPELKVKEWATTKAITAEELKGRPHVLEFWATWCPPCRVSIPHLNQLSQKVEPFGLPVIGLSNESIDKVKPFAAKMGMSYYVGIDDGMKGLTYRGIPFAAVINGDGKVAWAGHPMEPGFEAAVIEQAKAFKPGLNSALAAALEGSLAEAYQALQKMDGEAAQSAAAIINANFKQQYAHAESLTGLEQYKALQAVKELYAGIPAAAAIDATVEKLANDPAVKAEIAAERAVQELQQTIRELAMKAQALEKEESKEAAQQFYMAGLIPIFEAFIEKYPDHEAAAELRKAVPQIKAQLAALNQAAE
jgi:thiol-disulfide isomerase/thioredoxin